MKFIYKFLIFLFLLIFIDLKNIYLFLFTILGFLLAQGLIIFDETFLIKIKKKYKKRVTPLVKNVWFFIFLAIFSIFILTSSFRFIGFGFLINLWLSFIYEVYLFKDKKGVFNRFFGYQINKRFTIKESNLLFLSLVLYFLLLMIAIHQSSVLFYK